MPGHASPAPDPPERPSSGRVGALGARSCTGIARSVICRSRCRSGRSAGPWTRRYRPGGVPRNRSLRPGRPQGQAPPGDPELGLHHRAHHGHLRGPGHPVHEGDRELRHGQPRWRRSGRRSRSGTGSRWPAVPSMSMSSRTSRPVDPERGGGVVEPQAEHRSGRSCCPTGTASAGTMSSWAPSHPARSGIPTATSAPSSTAASSCGRTAGSWEKSASIWATTSWPWSSAWRKP